MDIRCFACGLIRARNTMQQHAGRNAFSVPIAPWAVGRTNVASTEDILFGEYVDVERKGKMFLRTPCPDLRLGGVGWLFRRTIGRTQLDDLGMSEIRNLGEK